MPDEKSLHMSLRVPKDFIMDKRADLKKITKTRKTWF